MKRLFYFLLLLSLLAGSACLKINVYAGTVHDSEQIVTTCQGDYVRLL